MIGQKKTRHNLDQTRTVRKEVSEYAGTMNLEFVAETFTGMVGGKKYNKKIMKWYNDEGGPKVS